MEYVKVNRHTFNLISFHLKESIDLLDSISILTPGNQESKKTRMVAIEKESAVFHRILDKSTPRPQVEKSVYRAL